MKANIMPVKFINPQDGKEMGAISVITKYFRKESETLSEFSAQIKQLSPSDKEELALGAAKELGITIVNE